MSRNWVTIDGSIVHPNAPAGGGGGGIFRSPAHLGSEVDMQGIAHPESPVGRQALLTEKQQAALKAQHAVSPVRLIAEAPKKPSRLPGEKEMIGEDIKCIAGSPFGATPEGRKIVDLLRRFNAQDQIAYGETQGHRGEYYGTGITVNKDYYGNACKTILELVHEASHATWRAKHPLAKGKPESIEDATDNELFTQVNQVAIHKWLKDIKHLCAPDPVMELRLERQAAGTLRSVIERNEKEDRGL